MAFSLKLLFAFRLVPFAPSLVYFILLVVFSCVVLLSLLPAFAFCCFCFLFPALSVLRLWLFAFCHPLFLRTAFALLLFCITFRFFAFRCLDSFTAAVFRFCFLLSGLLPSAVICSGSPRTSARPTRIVFTHGKVCDQKPHAFSRGCRTQKSCPSGSLQHRLCKTLQSLL